MAARLPQIEAIEDEDGVAIRTIPVMLVDSNGNEVGGTGTSGTPPNAELPTGSSVFPSFDAEEVGVVFPENLDRISASVQNINAFDIRITEDNVNTPSATVGYVLKPYHTARITTNSAVKVWANQAYSVAATETATEII